VALRPRLATGVPLAKSVLFPRLEEMLSCGVCLVYGPMVDARQYEGHPGGCRRGLDGVTRAPETGTCPVAQALASGAFCGRQFAR